MKASPWGPRAPLSFSIPLESTLKLLSHKPLLSGLSLTKSSHPAALTIHGKRCGESLFSQS